MTKNFKYVWIVFNYCPDFLFSISDSMALMNLANLRFSGMPRFTFSCCTPTRLGVALGRSLV